MAERIHLNECLKFLVGGGSAVITDYSLYRLLVFIGLSINPSKIISYIIGAAVGFVINKLWTFNSAQFSKMEIVRYIMLYVISACVNATVNKYVLLITCWTVFAFLCATGVSTVMNFLGQKYFVFTKKGEN